MDAWRPLLYYGVVLLLALSVVMLVGLALVSLQNTQFDFGEGFVVDAAARVSRGDNPYDESLYFAPYPPLFYLLLAPLIRLDPCHPLPLCRMLNIGLAVAATIIASMMARRLVDKGEGGLAFSAALVFSLIWGIPEARWLSLCRVDTLGILLVIASLYLVVRGGVKDLALSAILSILAMLVRPQYFALPAAMLLEAIAERRRRLLAYIVPLGVGGILAIGILALVSHGRILYHAFYTHLYMLRASDDLLPHMINAVFATHNVMVIMAVLLARLLEKHHLRVFPRILYVYLAVLLVASPAMALKPGAAGNYFIEEKIAAVVVVAASIMALVDSNKYRDGLAVLLVASLILTSTYHYIGSPSTASIRREYRLCTYISSLPLANDTLIVADNAYIVYLAGRSVGTETFILSKLIETDAEVNKTLFSLIKAGKVIYVDDGVTAPRLPQMERWLNETKGYVVVSPAPNTKIYLPKEAVMVRGPEDGRKTCCDSLPRGGMVPRPLIAVLKGVSLGTRIYLLLILAALLVDSSRTS